MENSERNLAEEKKFIKKKLKRFSEFVIDSMNEDEHAKYFGDDLSQGHYDFLEKCLEVWIEDDSELEN